MFFYLKFDVITNNFQLKFQSSFSSSNFNSVTVITFHQVGCKHCLPSSIKKIALRVLFCHFPTYLNLNLKELDSDRIWLFSAPC